MKRLILPIITLSFLYGNGLWGMEQDKNKQNEQQFKAAEEGRVEEIKNWVCTHPTFFTDNNSEYLTTN